MNKKLYGVVKKAKKDFKKVKDQTNYLNIKTKIVTYLNATPLNLFKILTGND
jgi:hypothetical protein